MNSNSESTIKVTLTLNHARRLLAVCGKYALSLTEMCEVIQKSNLFTPDVAQAASSEMLSLRKTGDELCELIANADPETKKAVEAAEAVVQARKRTVNF